MPPKKKTRQPSTTAPAAAGDDTEDHAKDASPILDEEGEFWTDEQEASLFKGMISWKPVGSSLIPHSLHTHMLTHILFLGMHKHFRMIAISEHLRNHGYTSAQDDHTRPAGIWKKLGHLYNLEGLDEIVCGPLVLFSACLRLVR